MLKKPKMSPNWTTRMAMQSSRVKPQRRRRRVCIAFLCLSRCDIVLEKEANFNFRTDSPRTEHRCSTNAKRIPRQLYLPRHRQLAGCASASHVRLVCLTTK